MAFFMFLSGIVLSEKQFGGRQWLFKRLKSLLIPFLSWAIISCIIYGENIIKGLLRRIIYIENGLWFLFSLAEISVCIWLHVNLVRKLTSYTRNYIASVLLSAGVLNVLIFVTNTMFGNIFGFSTLNLYYTVFLLGYYWKTIQKNSNTYKNICQLCVIIFVIYILGVCFDFRSLGLTSTNLYLRLSVKMLEKIIIPFAGSIGTYYAYCCFGKIGVISNIIEGLLEKIGKHTLAIYAMHWYFLNLFYVESKIITSAIGVCTAIVLPIVLEYIISKNRFLVRLLFGKS